MAICHYCKQDLDDSMGCDAQMLSRSDGELYDRVPYGEEQRQTNGRRPKPRCPNCRAALGMLHHPGCVTEECPACHKTLAACRCRLTVLRVPLEPEGSPHEITPEFYAIAPQKDEEQVRREVRALPTWRPTVEQSKDLLAALRLGQLAGCWQRGCAVTIDNGHVRHECQGSAELIPIAADVDIVERLKAGHVGREEEYGARD